jgi:anti-sigma factor RsiW
MSDVKSPDMTCNELVEVITEYLEGTLPAEDRSRFDEHIAECDGCTNYLDQMRQMIAALGHLPPESLSPEAEETLLTAFRGWRDGG